MNIQSSHSVQDWKKEILLSKKHRYIVEVLGYCRQDTKLTIVMEYLLKGNLCSVLHDNIHEHPLSILQRLRMALNCAQGLQHLHDNNIMHRNVNSKNILVTDDYGCKLSDFGCAKLLSNSQVLNTAKVGTPSCMAPEVKYGVYSLPADIFSFGVVLFELFERMLPKFDQSKQTFVFPETYKSANLVHPCFNADASKRPTAKMVVNTLTKIRHQILAAIQSNLQKSDPAKDKSFDDLYSELLFQRKPVDVDNLIEQSLPFC